jgi:pimeloyl-ACP methyl ester carboxylesterase
VAASLAGMEEGWNHSLDRLADYVATAGATVNDRGKAMDHASSKEYTVPATLPRTGYAPVNGLQMYYEIHGAGHPLVMLHGGLETIAFSLGGALLPSLAETRQVIAIEQQGHGHTADIDRPLTYEQMAEDTAALLRYLEITDADVFGYSMGGMTALGLATRHPDLVRKLVIVSAPYNNGGMRSENLAGMQSLTPEALAGSPQESAYLRAAPNPSDWPTLLIKMGPLQRDFRGWPAEAIRAIAAPTLFVFGDSDAIPLDHAVELFRLRGGDVNGDFAGVPESRLAILPGTTHLSMMTRADLLLPMVSTYLDAPTDTA